MDGKRRKKESGGSRKKRLRLDPVVGWGEGEVGQEDQEIQDWLIRKDSTDSWKENNHHIP